MIGYRITRAELEKRSQKAWAGWPAKAAERTAHFRAVGEYDEKSGSWGKIKSVFMELQHSK